MSIRILHTADLHLGSEYKSFHEKSNDLQQESFQAFEKLITYTIDPNHEIDILLIAGDLFENHRPDRVLVTKVKELLLKVTEKNIKLYLLPGNHDSYIYKNSIYRTVEFPGKLISNHNFQLIDDPIIKKTQFYIYSGLFELNNPDKKILNNFKIVDQKGVHLGLLHGTLDMKDEMVPDYGLPFTFEQFKDSGLNYLALGHFHKFKIQEVDKNHKLAYSGSLVPRTIDEYDEKSALLVDIEPDKFITTENVSFSNIRIEKRIIDVIKENINDVEDLLEHIKKGKDENLIIDLYLEGIFEIPVNEVELKQILNDYYYYIRITNNFRYINSSVIKQLREEETIRGMFFRNLQEKAKDLPEDKKHLINQAINFGLRDFTQARGEDIVEQKKYQDVDIDIVDGEF
jgi:DNA repair exonuclease SbcCD nuclease subunit